MKRFIIGVLIFAVAGFAGHTLTLKMVPKLIMNKAMSQMEARGIALHDFTLSERNTPQTQTVVRPSPDLAYSICLFDLSKTEQVSLRVGAWDKVASISFFDARTNNFATVRLDPVDETRLVLRREGDEGGSEAVLSPTSKGIILIRRLASTDADYARIETIAKTDQCKAEG